MRIMIVGSTYLSADNGQAIFTINLAEGLVQRGHSVLVVSPSNQGKSFQKEINGVKVTALRSIQMSWWHANVDYPLYPGPGIQQAFRTFHPDIVHIQDHYPISQIAINYARRYGVKKVGTNHFVPANLAPYLTFISHMKPVYNYIMWKWMLFVFEQLDVATAPSRTAAAILRSQGLRVPVFPVSCGVDQSRFRPLPDVDRQAIRQRYGLSPDRLTFLFVGRVDMEKRLDVLLRAMQHLQRDDLQLVIAGRGAAFNQLTALANQLKLGERVHFAGFIPPEDLPSLLNSVDFFTMPSEAELLSIASLEAMACRRPLLAARAQALPELVTDGINGYLFRPGDPADAARYMAMLADQADRWRSMGDASLKKVHRHGLEFTLRSYETIYEVLLARAPLPSQQPIRTRIQKALDQL